MAVSKDKSRIIVVVDKKIKENLIKLSKNEQRSLSNMCSIILTNYINNKERNDNN